MIRLEVCHGQIKHSAEGNIGKPTLAEQSFPPAQNIPVGYTMGGVVTSEIDESIGSLRHQHDCKRDDLTALLKEGYMQEQSGAKPDYV